MYLALEITSVRPFVRLKSVCAFLFTKTQIRQLVEFAGK